MDIHNNFLTIFTMDGFLKIYDISNRDPRLVTGVRSLYDMCTDFGEIIQAKTNSTGTKVALTIAAANLIPDGKLYVWDIEQDDLSFYDFRKNESQVYDEEGNVIQNPSLDEDDSNEIYDKICKSRIPLTTFWDWDDPRLLVCDAKKLKSGKEKKQFTGIYMKAKNGNSFVKLYLSYHIYHHISKLVKIQKTFLIKKFL